MILREGSRGKQRKAEESLDKVIQCISNGNESPVHRPSMPVLWRPQRAQNMEASQRIPSADCCIACMPSCYRLPGCEVLSCVPARRVPSCCMLPSCALLRFVQSRCVLRSCELPSRKSAANDRSAVALGTAAEEPEPESSQTCAHTGSIRPLSTSTRRVRGNRRACDSR